MVSSQTIHTYKPIGLSWMVISEALFECHDLLILGVNRIEAMSPGDMTMAVEWDVKHQFNFSRITTKLKS